LGFIGPPHKKTFRDANTRKAAGFPALHYPGRSQEDNKRRATLLNGFYIKEGHASFWRLKTKDLARQPKNTETNPNILNLIIRIFL
jgi:hypothetical protein